MKAATVFKKLGWKHEIWQWVRYYNSVLKRDKEKELFLKTGNINGFTISPDNLKLLNSYIQYRERLLPEIYELLRTEEEAKLFCERLGVEVGTTTTRSRDHHQSSKAMVAAAGYLAVAVASRYGLTAEINPQKPAVWCERERLIVTARNLDGAIPSLENPRVVWEIKEYWGKTQGGSKMSDAIYECMLVGMELRISEEEFGARKVWHALLLDGREQWGCRISDLRRAIDILHQGLIDVLIVGKEVETEWAPFLESVLAT